MLDSFREKLNSIIDYDFVERREGITDKEIRGLVSKYELNVSDEYIYYLRISNTRYIKDNYLYKPSYDVWESVKQVTFRVSCLFGLDDNVGNLEDEWSSHEDILPNNLLPIGDMMCGNLVCMDKVTGEIYLWYHDEIEEKSALLVDYSFAQFIMNIDYYEDTNVENKSVKLNFSSELDVAIRKAAEKYRNR